MSSAGEERKECGTRGLQGTDLQWQRCAGSRQGGACSATSMCNRHAPHSHKPTAHHKLVLLHGLLQKGAPALDVAQPHQHALLLPQPACKSVGKAHTSLSLVLDLERKAVCWGHVEEHEPVKNLQPHRMRKLLHCQPSWWLPESVGLQLCTPR